MSPISSRNTVPRSATSSSPGLACTAPVNAPRSWPKSSVSRNSRSSPAQLRSMKTSSARRLFPWIQLASTPFPEPVSPWIRIGLSLLTTRRINSSSRRIDELSPRNGLSFSRFAFDSRTRNCFRKRRLSMARTNRVCNTASSTGFVRNCSAPSLIARSASSMEPGAASIMTGTSASALLKCSSNSRPPPSGRATSTIAASAGPMRNFCLAVCTPSASITCIPCSSR